jgi:hypothetical protein
MRFMRLKNIQIDKNKNLPIWERDIIIR